MNNDKKIFAFKLAEKKEKEQEKAAKWQARNGVSVAGCTESDSWGNYRSSRSIGTDNGIYC